MEKEKLELITIKARLLNDMDIWTSYLKLVFLRDSMCIIIRLFDKKRMIATLFQFDDYI